jgi:hypothetical protein
VDVGFLDFVLIFGSYVFRHDRQGDEGTQEDRQARQEAKALDGGLLSRREFVVFLPSGFLVQIRGCSEYCCLISRIISFRADFTTT